MDHQQWIGKPWTSLDTPTLCVDLDTLERNIQRMAALARDAGVALRPHIKTHKCPQIAQMLLDAGAAGITCAKVSEAEVMVDAGITDILIANQIVGAFKIQRLVSLAKRSQLTVAVDDADNVAMLSKEAERAGVTVGVLVEVDVGMGRCGVAPMEPALALAQTVAALPGLELRGVMGYEGHAVMIPDATEREQAVQAALTPLVETAALLRDRGLTADVVSAAGTGTAAMTARFPGITEIQPGSYATMDARYGGLDLGFEPSVTIVAQVISVPREDRAVLDAGLKSATTEFGNPPVRSPEGWRLAHLSEEHGVLHREGGSPLALGDRVALIPTHGCTTNNLHDRFFAVQGGIVAAVWPIAARGCLQ